MAETAIGDYGSTTLKAVREWTQKEKPGSYTLGLLVSLYQPKLFGLFIPFAYLLVGLFIYAGWKQRMDWPMSAETGTGYMLGIIGGTLMLLLLLYPVRKHNRRMHNWGAIKYWFRIHMLFGVLGPVAIIYHSGFKLGSMNSSIALYCMLIVAISGLIGRYFYTKIHHGLYGRRTDVEELQRHADVLRESIPDELSITPDLLDKIKHFKENITTKAGGIHTSIWVLLSVGFRTWLLYFRFRRSINGKPSSSSIDGLLIRHVGAHLSSIRKLAEYRFYERFFKIWHVVHLPLFLMLVLSGILHVVAVHMY